LTARQLTKFRHFTLCWATIAAVLLLLLPACRAQSAQPSDVKVLEHQVALEIAHQRIKLSRFDKNRLERLNQAQELDLAGEKALKARNLPAAREAFERAHAIVIQMGD
jgi:hypothetical protein